jgi:3-dehydroquinate synthase
VAIGIALDVIYSRNIGLLDAASADRILALLRKLGLELFANELLHLDAEHQPMVLKGLEEFREHLGGELTLTMLRGIGAGVEVHEIVLPKMLEALAELQQHYSRTSIVALPKAAL